MFRQNEDAVSPVIGVILMVAITVILAAVIAMFVFNMTGDVQATKTVGVTAKLNGSADVDVLLVGGVDTNQLEKLTFTVDGTKDVVKTSNFDVGSIVVVNATSGDRVMVIGLFNDGSEQILLDKQF